MCKKNINTENIIVIPSIVDPRSTMENIAFFQNSFDITPPMPIVVIYGTCPDKDRARGEGNQKVFGWNEPWELRKWKDFEKRFIDIAKHNGVPIFFFDKNTQKQVWDQMIDIANKQSLEFPSGLKKEDFIQCVDRIFSSTYSYGAQRNKAFIVANSLFADRVFFFDDDTYLPFDTGNMMDRHSQLLDYRDVFAVTGGYIGARAFNAAIFRRIKQQHEFMGLLGYEIPDDQATRDLLTWRLADGVLGGNFCIKSDTYEQICCPAAHRIPTTDDKLIGREIRRVFGKQANVYKTGWGVLHIHFPSRMDRQPVIDYLRSWAKTKAFWTIYDQLDVNGFKLESDCTEIINNTSDVVGGFGKRLSELAITEKKVAPSDTASAIEDAAYSIFSNPRQISEIVLSEMREFQKLKLLWPIILKESRNIDIWNSQNCFTPKGIHLYPRFDFLSPNSLDDKQRQTHPEYAEDKEVTANKVKDDSTLIESPRVPADDRPKEIRVTISDKQDNNQKKKPSETEIDLTEFFEAWLQLPPAFRSFIIKLIKAWPQLPPAFRSTLEVIATEFEEQLLSDKLYKTKT